MKLLLEKNWEIYRLLIATQQNYTQKVSELTKSNEKNLDIKKK